MTHSSGSLDAAPRYQINEAAPVPLYYQIKQQIKQNIVGGVLSPGTALPSERELCERYGVSRPTVRQAMQELLAEGLLERRRGIGTYVAQPRIQHQLASLQGFSERMEREGRTPGTLQLEQRTLTRAEVDANVASVLGIGPRETVLRLVRLRLANDEPILLETVHLPLARFGGLDTINLEQESLYRTLRNRYGVAIYTLRETLEPIVLDQRHAALLGTQTGSPAMLTRITTYDQAGLPVEYTHSLVRGDRCQYLIEFHVGEASKESSVHLRQTQLEISL
jgi:GntR family transcriptional regulator